MPTTVIVTDGSLSAETVALIDRIMDRPTTHAAIAPDLPRPATPREGERYAGIVLAESGKPSHHLFLLDVKPAKKMNWKDSTAWAESVGDGMPSTAESLVLCGNLKSQFDTSEYHWTSTQYSASYAWIQGFGRGYQGYNGKSREFLARAVRRLEI